MCGRYERNADREELEKQFPFIANDYFDVHGYKESREIFPGTPIMAVNNRFEAEDIWWTIRDRTWDGKMAATVNAKAETIQKVQMFRDAFKTDRVLIPATGLFEWQIQPDKSKVKYRIWFDEPVFAFAGIARDCDIKDETKRCGVIITTSPNDIFKEIHNTKMRQAVVIRERDYEKWLDPKTTPDDLKAMMQPLPTQETHYEKV